MNDFYEMGLPLLLGQALDKNSLSIPTPIQAQAIPLALKGKDILGSAQTGTGKTLAFAIPLIAKLLGESNASSALVIVPTRELAQQVTNEIRKLLFQNSVLKIALLIGGEPIFRQQNQLQRRPQIIIGTPGRIIDHIERKTLMTSNVSTLVLDEIDRMLDMGFRIQIEGIMKHLPKMRQTLMFSAALPGNIVKLAEKYLNQPERVFVEHEATTPAKIKQEIVYASELEKYGKLVTQLCQREGSTIIFVKTKQGADQLAYKLRKDNHSALAIHGDLKQHKRERVINSFRRGYNQIMVATDIASRGLDISHIQHVINYDAPQSQANYIHRIGRTARAGAEGHALSFITPQDKKRLPALTDKKGELNFDCNVQFKKRSSKKVSRRLSTLKIKYGRKKISTFKKKSTALEKMY
ncbi:DEAD/DEAH box helicase [Wolbachia endosymbiont of Litomosoides brasiliensis]|uniref:DEAD/DEAH box helicase n=1 Tax=Wolbachia endosymbiont of Litomosoides brasiliensis TaxID=1812117 RepID=UPI00158A8ABF|nr:DEAD/DEAH box helicase [Wolbachia endosymbiont of Litomosoides brasiliensis]NUY39444.1 DEAD/DEAH box helicase [Wolbachia endosymbiont of Litomosoides brasiliensis]